MEVEKEERRWCIYIHTNKINNKAYIGITSNNPKKRWKNGQGYKTNKYFYTSIQKYGWDNFEHFIFMDNLSKNEAQKIEIMLIALFNTTNPNHGYNFSTGGEGSSGAKRSEETRLKLSKNAKERFATPENNVMYGKHHSEESKNKISQSKIGKHTGEDNHMYGRPWWDENTPQEKIDEWKQGISLRTRGEKNPNYGVKCTEEKRSKLIESNPNTQAVIHIGVNGDILEIYRSKREVNRITGIDRRTLNRYCSGNKIPRDGTKWMLLNEYKTTIKNIND